MNSTANATEMRLSAPTIASPIAAVSERPTSRLMKTATMSRPDRNASHRMVSTIRIVAVVLRKAPSFTVAYSSSAIGTGPVSRSLAPYCEAMFRSAAALRMASVDFCPGVSAEKSSTGLISMKRRRSLGVGGLPLSIARQEKLAGRPAITSSMVSATMLRVSARSSSE